MEIKTHIPLDGLINARHLGGYPTSNGTLTNQKAYIRCENPEKLTQRDMETLYNFGIRTVIDLRSPEEIAQSPNPLCKNQRFRYYAIPVFSTNGAPDALAQRQIDMGQVYIEMVDQCGSSFYKIIDIILNTKGGVLFHCSAGKDRTGVLAALLLLACGVPEQDVVEEYTYTEQLLSPLIKKLQSKVPAGMDPTNLQAMLAAKPNYIMALIKHLNQVYGGAKGYLLHLGFQQQDIDMLCNRLLNCEEGVA